MLHHLLTSLLSLVDLSHVLTFAGAPLLLATAPVGAPAGGSGGDAADDDDGGSAEPTDFKAIGDAILSGMSDEERNRPFAGAGDPDDEPDDVGAGAAADDVDDDEGAAAPVADDEGDGLEGRAAVDEVEGEDDPDKAKDGEGDAAGDEPAGIKVTLPGLTERGEEELEIEVDSEEVATRLRRLKNDGIRAKEYAARRGDLERREGELESYREAIEHDPVAFHLEQMSVDKQLEVARALILEHLDVLQPDIDKLIEDPKARLDAQRAQLTAQRDSRKKLEESRAIKQHVQKCMRAVEKLIPEGIDGDTATEFVNDARQEMAMLARKGQRVTPETIPALLARRMKLYGFDKPKPAPKAAAPAKKPAAAAEAPRATKPIGKKAEELAAGKAKPAAAPQARVRRTQAARNAGSKVAPAGAGAAPVQLPAVPAEAESDVASMSKYLRDKKLPESWNSGSE